MRDPVNGFEYPGAWERKIEPEDRVLVEKGLSILTADGSVLRRGYTTGTSAAAAAKAAVLSLVHPVTKGVGILTPSGIRVFVLATGTEGYGVCSKFSGDYPDDVTAGIRFHAKAIAGGEGITISAGTGIGVWARSNPRYQKGAPAISPPAYKEIRGAISEALSACGLDSVQVTISAEDGERIAERTLNEKVGVTGGISVLGSTGFVEPWDDHLEESALQRISDASLVVLTTGRIGLRFSRLLFPDHEAILVGSRLDPAVKAITGGAVICGLPALILKYIEPSFLEGSGYGTVEEMIGTPEFHRRADRALLRFCNEHQGIRIVLVDRAGTIIKDAP
jgi:cobalt-precorrin-5B (C1)-methyltransferase